jgi:hypothetical protein
MTQRKEEGLNIELSEEMAEGKYSNLAVITHSPAEFILDFIALLYWNFRIGLLFHESI